ncbi:MULTISPECIES: hypothetical protein [unclassified Pseudonocardia]|uniref:hypothetical protein n=3 Tax=Pseudonocardia TaxID=1847 RepID=UPI00094B29B6|nr:MULTISPECIES: hypothetical protein [unclassified Pseudonocardia]
MQVLATLIRSGDYSADVVTIARPPATRCAGPQRMAVGVANREATMGIGRYVLAGVIATTLVSVACTAASGADRVAAESTTPLAVNQSVPAAALLPRLDAGSSSLSATVAGAIEAVRREVDRAAAAEKKAAEEKAQAQEAARRGQVRQPTDKTRETRKSGGNCAQRAIAAGKFDPSCSAYQGYLDPGTLAGRAPTSGEIQMQYACEQGLVPKSDC